MATTPAQIPLCEPDMDKVSTSYIERFNLTTRMQLRRFTRLTNGFSKKLENHAAAIALYVAHYNFCRVHETLRMTPAMALGITNHIWSIEELIEAALKAPEAPTTPPAPKPTLPRDPKTGLLMGRRPFRLRMIPGGKIGSPRPARRLNH